MTIYEADLPGVGKKFEVELDADRRLVIVIHNTGRREVFFRPTPDADSEKLFELSDQLAREVGTILEGAYFQPIEADRINTVIDEDSLLEWENIGENSPLVGQTLREAELRNRIGISVLAIQREEEIITNPDPGAEIRAGDTLIVVGDRASLDEFDSYLSDDSDLGQ